MLSFIRYLRLTYKLNNGLGGVSLFQHIIIFFEWKNQIASKKYPLDLELPWITIAAKKYIISYFNKKSINKTSVLEYGSGGSSLFFLKFSTNVTSIEHDEMWFNKVLKEVSERSLNGWNGLLVKPSLLSTEIEISKLNPSEPSHYYSGDSQFTKHSFENYVTQIDQFENEYFDVVLIDGRSRPSCMAHAFKKVKKNGLLVLDNAEVDYYLEKIKIDNDFKLQLSVFGALICSDKFTKTNIYKKVVNN